MKKLMYLTVVGIAVLALAACSSVAPTETGQPTKPPVTAAPHVEAPESTAPVLEGFQPMVLADNEEICVKITGMENDPVWGYTLNVYLENKTDKELMFTVDNVTINRYMCDPFWAESVPAGMKSNSSIRWFEGELQANSTSDAEEITFTLRVYDVNDFDAEDVLLKQFTITP